MDVRNKCTHPRLGTLSLPSDISCLRPLFDSSSLPPTSQLSQAPPPCLCLAVDPLGRGVEGESQSKQHPRPNLSRLGGETKILN